MSSGHIQNKDAKTNVERLRVARIQAESHQLQSDQIKNECARIRLLTYLKDFSLYK